MINVEINMVLLLVCQCLELAKIIVKEVRYKLIKEYASITYIQIPVNFPVVSGGFALLAASGGVQAVVGAAAPALSTSFVGGAAGLLGKEENYK